MKAHARSTALTIIALCATVGCPQLKEDDFVARVSSGAAGSGGAGATPGVAGQAGGDGLGGSSGGGGACDRAPGGCGDAGPGRAGAGAGGAASSPTQDDGGAAPAVVGCSPGEVTAPNGVCYFIDSTGRTWADARASCQARGAGWDLVPIYDTARNDFVLSITGFEAWLGATDAADEGTWLWVDSETPFFAVGATTNTGFAYWSDGEPNDYEGSDCLRILTTGAWADWPCDSLLGHVCRRAP